MSRSRQFQRITNFTGQLTKSQNDSATVPSSGPSNTGASQQCHINGNHLHRAETINNTAQLHIGINCSSNTIILQPNDEAEKSIVRDRDVLSNPMHASALVEVVHEIRSSSAALFVNGAGFCDLTPNSITKLLCKYSQDAYWAPAVELQCYKNDGLDYVSQGVSLDGIRVGWEPDETLPQKLNDEVSIGPVVPTMVEEVPEDFPNPILVALWMVLEANAIQAYLASLTPEELKTVSTHPFELTGSWQKAKSRRHRKATSKKSKGSMDINACRSIGRVGEPLRIRGCQIYPIAFVSFGMHFCAGMEPLISECTMSGMELLCIPATMILCRMTPVAELVHCAEMEESSKRTTMFRMEQICRVAYSGYLSIWISQNG
ncbi:hypothetical protein Nepgr_001076 [Nepenthes gracilis]|uniref:Uncharacterized protein n=1 Tax=Nepenthes gracilis TaxID=150966 RepID=A0AAD3RVU5_NEPGR|nr:hypothetical protein Nepgr_001076 [Nepenthes gracilis]